MALKARIRLTINNPLLLNIKIQILLPCPHTFLIELSEEKLLKYQENSSWVIISSFLITSDRLSMDITRRNLMLITNGAKSVKTES